MMLRDDRVSARIWRGGERERRGEARRGNNRKVGEEAEDQEDGEVRWQERMKQGMTHTHTTSRVKR
jgi:hypothetical protein